jgi:hypothetical protein
VLTILRAGLFLGDAMRHIFRFLLLLSALAMGVNGTCLAQGTGETAGVEAVARPSETSDAVVAPIKRRKVARAGAPVSRPAVARAAKTGKKTIAKNAKKNGVRTSSVEPSVKK